MKIQTSGMTNEEYILTYRDADVRALALKKVPEGVDAPWCLRQIEGYQLSKKKLPRWAGTEGVWFPPRLSMEQCSSEVTARYKAEVALRIAKSRESFIDLTGGFGVDFSYMAQNFKSAIYVEQQEVLCEAARHNFPLLGIENAEIVNTADYSTLLKTHYSLIYLDPARRSDTGKKVYAIEDCTPDIATLQDKLLERADSVMVKLSPMLDITQALRTLHNVTEVHTVSVKGECKELLLVMSAKSEAGAPIIYHCVNLDTNDSPFICDVTRQPLAITTPEVGDYIFEPNASILKAGVQDAFAACYSLGKLHPMSNLFTMKKGVGVPDGIPARAFRITAMSDFSKSALKIFLKDLKQANIAIRNFPSTVNELRKRLKIKEGGSVYIFATTVSNGSHILIRCEKV